MHISLLWSILWEQTYIHYFDYSCHCRIHKNMLMDLSKDIMMDLGITVIGDIIAILKHAKQVYRQVRADLTISCSEVLKYWKWIGHCHWCRHVQTKATGISPLLLWMQSRRMDIFRSYCSRLSLHNLCNVYPLFRTCAKWPLKPSPQDRPVLKLSSEELPILVSTYILSSYINHH